jgi:hypothetical protein
VKEAVERRVFGAVEFIDDLTEVRVLAPLHIAAPPGIGLRRNRLGLYVIHSVPAQDAYTRAFDDPPAQPARQDFALQVQDPQQRYLPRAFSLALPRWLPTPQAPVADADNALEPLPLRLYPGAARPLRASWAVLRVSLQVEGSSPPLGLANVLIEAKPQVAGLPAQHTLTDRRGEALLAIRHAPAVLPDAGPPGLTREFEVDLQFVLDAAVVRTSDQREIPVPNPNAVLDRRAAGHAQVRVVAAAEPLLLSAGASRRHVEKVPWP